MKVSKIEVDELVDGTGSPLLDLKQVGVVWTGTNDGGGWYLAGFIGVLPIKPRWL